ncbi:hypothetical protein CAP40_16780 [Sphingomonas sp. IBVSS2]|uniref:hypothetical protein n=1 Tax=Sphingomonas sp. IBVSS2 TaxID=1985172 RepID=UPI000A2DB8FA|nr:hypothetical protein [Sphingomonas sp. IBVSS2]OSZ64319.1 hypothetical protein CAP40_16780 [Sphingomonas sp. IBVSS2]
MKEFRLFASCLMLASCGNEAKPVTMTDQRLIAGLRACGIDPADAVQVNEQGDGNPRNYLVFSHVAPYPEAKMRCLARTLEQAQYGISKSDQSFEDAYLPAWKAEFALYMQKLAISWLREHRPGKSSPQFMPGKLSLGAFARSLEEFCGARPGALSVERQSVRIPFPEDEPQSECLLMAALAANPEKHGFAVQNSNYE